jgi:hypothetical protein
MRVIFTSCNNEPERPVQYITPPPAVMQITHAYRTPFYSLAGIWIFGGLFSPYLIEVSFILLGLPRHAGLVVKELDLRPEILFQISVLAGQPICNLLQQGLTC